MVSLAGWPGGKRLRIPSGDRIVKEKEKCTYNKFVILQPDGSEYSELFTPRITFMNRAREPKTKEEQCVAELPSCLKLPLMRASYYCL